MTSIAIWPQIESTTPDRARCSIKLHINLWTIPLFGKTTAINLNRFYRLIDIGVLVDSEACDIKHLFLYMPAKIENEEILDLYKEMIRNPGTTTTPLIGTIFNRIFKTAIIDGKDRSEVTDQSTSEKFDIFKLNGVGLSSTIEEVTDSDRTTSIIKITPAPSRKFYFRFRINNKELANRLWTQETLPKAPLQSAFSQNEIIELRINEKRNLPAIVLNKMESNVPLEFRSKITIDSTDFIYVCAQSEDITHYHAAPRKSRRLEPKLWEQYSNLKLSESPTPLLAYHWREDKSKGILDWNSNILIKSRHEVRNWKIIIRYLGYALLFGLMTNFIYDGIKHYVLKKLSPNRSATSSKIVDIKHDTGNKKE